MVGVVSVKSWPGRLKTLEESAYDASSVLDSSVDFPDLTAYIPTVEVEIVEEDALWDLTDLTSIDGCRPSALQCVQELCRNHCLPVQFDVWSVQVLIIVVLVALAFVDSDETSLTNLKETHAFDKVELQNSRTASEENLPDAKRLIQEL